MDTEALPPGARLLPLSKGAYALVDEAVFEWLSQWKWHLGPEGYATRTTYNPKRNITLHRALMEPIPPGHEIDHINRNRLDNRRSNLRIVTHQINLQNRTPGRRNTSGYLGIYLNKRKGKWAAEIIRNKQYHFIGYFHDIEQAKIARDAFAATLEGTA